MLSVLGSRPICLEVLVVFEFVSIRLLKNDTMSELLSLALVIG